METKRSIVSKAIEIELHPDGWARFEGAVDAALKSGPKPKVIPKAEERPASKRRVHKGKTGA
jgi:hypothetical protein